MSGYTKSDMAKMYRFGILDALYYPNEIHDTETVAEEIEQDFESRLAKVKEAKAVQPKRGEDADRNALEAEGCPPGGIMRGGFRIRDMFAVLDSEEPPK